MPRNDWNEYKKLVLYETKQNREMLENVVKKLDAISLDVRGLKVKAALAGGVAGIVGTAIVTFAVSLWK